MSPVLCYGRVIEKTAEVVVIGGGIIGGSIANHLAFKNIGRIVLLEKGQLGEGSKSRCIGRIRTQFSTEINVRFSLESIKVLSRKPEMVCILGEPEN